MLLFCFQLDFLFDFLQHACEQDDPEKWLCWTSGNNQPTRKHLRHIHVWSKYVTSNHLLFLIPTYLALNFSWHADRQLNPSECFCFDSLFKPNDFENMCNRIVNRSDQVSSYVFFLDMKWTVPQLLATCLQMVQTKTVSCILFLGIRSTSSGFLATCLSTAQTKTVRAFSFWILTAPLLNLQQHVHQQFKEEQEAKRLVGGWFMIRCG